MFLDASAIVAILNREDERDALLAAIQTSPTPPAYSALSRFEAVVSLARDRSGPNRSATTEAIAKITAGVDMFLAACGATCLDLTEDIGTAALAAAQTYGRCVGHPASLNLGDCFAYASARSANMPLLYKGRDFAQTDMG